MARQLAIYRYRGCPFCVRVERFVEQLDLEVELRDIQVDPGHMRDLLAARQRRTVPVLRIWDEDVGTEQWMGESADILRWLRAEYGS